MNTIKPSKRTWIIAASLGLVATGAWVLKSHHTAERQEHARMETKQREALTAGNKARRLPITTPAPSDKKYLKAREAVAEAIRDDPERLSAVGPIPDFDEKEFEADPEAYLVRAEPARSLQSAKPGPDATRLEAVSPQRAEIKTNQPMELEVKGVASAPVTFTTFDGGYFKENGLPTISVQADEAGSATVHYVAGPGIGGDVTIVAGSPLATGRQEFFLSVGDSET
jgi:hypothetical protein